MKYEKCKECPANKTKERCLNHRKSGFCELLHLCGTCTICTALEDPLECKKIRPINKPKQP